MIGLEKLSKQVGCSRKVVKLERSKRHPGAFRITMGMKNRADALIGDGIPERALALILADGTAKEHGCMMVSCIRDAD